MDAKLEKAATSGDVDFLRQVGNNCKKYLSTATPRNETIFYLAARTNSKEFFAEAMDIISDPSLIHHLLSKLYVNPESGRSPSKWNSLHMAAGQGHLEIVKLILDFYRSNDDQNMDPKPWVVQDLEGDTPLLVALYCKKEACALEILSVDMQVLCNMVDNYKNSPLYQAVDNGCNQVALHIMNSLNSYAVSGQIFPTPLHVINHSSEDVCRLLLEKHPEFIKQVFNTGKTVLHDWTKKDMLWPLGFIQKWVDDDRNTAAFQFKTQIIDSIYMIDESGDSPFHVAVRHQKIEAAKILVDFYRQVRGKKLASISLLNEEDHYSKLPWLLPNNKNETPLELAMSDNKLAIDEYARLKKRITDMKSVIQGKSDVLFLALSKRLYKAAEEIWNIQEIYGFCTYSTRGWDFLHAALEFSDEVATWVANKLSLSPEANLIDNTLRIAVDIDASQFAEWMLTRYSSTLVSESNVWIEACQKGCFSIIIAIVNKWPDFRKLCQDRKDSPLHHVKFQGYEQYRNLLKNPTMLEFKNLPNENGETPLHKAIKNLNLPLAEALLTIDGVDRNILDKEHKTAEELLIKVCKDNKKWAEMCKHNGIFIPGLQTTFLQDKTNLLDVRNTLSVVAALLATITFTAGFTLPGGVKSDSSGKATLANKAAFLFFLLADTLALCCSMLVLVCLIWSMVDHGRALLLIDQSLSVLLIALYSTLLAFMTGVYVVIPRKSSWASIVVIVVLSVFCIISIKRSIMYKLLDMLSQKRYRDEDTNGEESPLVKQGEVNV